MTWPKWADALLAVSSGCAADCDLKQILSVLLKVTAGLLKKCVHVLFQFKITNEIPVTLL